MPKCGICGGDAPKQPCITEDDKCDLCGRNVVLAEEKKKIDAAGCHCMRI